MEQPDPIDVAIGARIRVLRKARGLSQAQLGKRLGVSPQQIQKYERGTNRLAGSALSRAARALDVSIGELFREGPDTLAAGSFDWPLLTSPGAIDLLRAFRRIAQPQERAAVIDLARILAGPKDR